MKNITTCNVYTKNMDKFFCAKHHDCTSYNVTFTLTHTNRRWLKNSEHLTPDGTTEIARISASTVRAVCDTAKCQNKVKGNNCRMLTVYRLSTIQIYLLFCLYLTLLPDHPVFLERSQSSSL